MKNSARRVDLKNKTIVIMYMLYFGDMVSITPFLEVLRREAEGSRIVLVMDSSIGLDSLMRFILIEIAS